MWRCCKAVYRNPHHLLGAAGPAWSPRESLSCVLFWKHASSLQHKQDFLQCLHIIIIFLHSLHPAYLSTFFLLLIPFLNWHLGQLVFISKGHELTNFTAKIQTPTCLFQPPNAVVQINVVTATFWSKRPQLSVCRLSRTEKKSSSSRRIMLPYFTAWTSVSGSHCYDFYD